MLRTYFLTTNGQLETAFAAVEREPGGTTAQVINQAVHELHAGALQHDPAFDYGEMCEKIAKASVVTDLTS